MTLKTSIVLNKKYSIESNFANTTYINKIYKKTRLYHKNHLFNSKYSLPIMKV